MEQDVAGTPEPVDVLGVRVDPLSVDQLHARILRAVRGNRRTLILNANVHCLNLCYRDSKLREFVNRADAVFCDGTGVMLAARMLGRRVPERITYADWMWRLAAFCEVEGLSLHFLGARPGVAEKAARRLKERSPGLEISGVRHGYFDHAAGSPENEAIIEEINAADPDILLLGLGMPLQEKWLMENRSRLNARVVLTGGAAFDYVSGEVRRGPDLLVHNGFEWLARLVMEPRRLWRRYLIGNPLFLFRVAKQRLKTLKFP